MDLLVEAELMRAGSEPGCLLCRVGEESAQHYLRTVLHEGVNDAGTRSRLDRSWGFCRRHAWCFVGLEWRSMHDSLSTATLAEALVDMARGAIDRVLDGPPSANRRRVATSLGALARSLGPAESCPACQTQAEHERYATTALVRTLENSACRQRFEASDGLCLLHFRDALMTGEAPEWMRWLAEDERRRLRELTRDLEEYGRKHDHRFRHETYGREADAAIRATEALVGSWLDLPRVPRTAAGTRDHVAPMAKEDPSHA